VLDVESLLLVPSHISVGTTEFGARTVGCLRVMGSGSTAHIGLELPIDLAALGDLEAAIGQARSELVKLELARR
jgi:hypothetical protein